MTNEELIADLKQFIVATVSQQLADVATKDDIKEAVSSLRTEIKADIRALDDKLDTIQDAIADVVEDHEKRITRLEQQRA